MKHPIIIQGGMGIAVSSWSLARAVSKEGELGVVSGTALATVFSRRLQLGDLDGAMRRALKHFPYPDVAARIEHKYFIEGGKDKTAAFATVPMPSLNPGAPLVELTVVANFVEVFLAKEGHAGVVGINLLEKIQLPTLASIYGAMLAGVDYVLMGAGIPRSIPGILDLFSEGHPAEMKIEVSGAEQGDHFVLRFDPKMFGDRLKSLARPYFIAIVSSATLALTLAKKSNGKVDGFVVEGDKAGGHNAPPRGAMQCDATGQPIYGERDIPDLVKIKELGIPFWLAGSYGRPEKLKDALKLGATGIQVGTAFAFCDESGIETHLKVEAIRASRSQVASVFTDPVASPTGFPFKIVNISNTIGEALVYLKRERVCDLGYLRELFKKSDGNIGYRCSGEPIEEYFRKGGREADTVGRKCLCNGLAATVGYGQCRGSGVEAALVTAGNEFTDLSRLIREGMDSYTALDVIKYLRSYLDSITLAEVLAPVTVS